MSDWLKDLDKPKPKEVKVETLLSNREYYEEPNIMYEVAKKRLEPTLDIDFNKIANLSSFQRFLIEVIKQQFPETFRGVNGDRV